MKINVTFNVTPAAARPSDGLQAGGRGRHLDHAVLMPGRPFLAQFDVAAHALGVRRPGLRIFQQRIQLEADVAVVAGGRLPDGQEDLLGLVDQFVGHLPGDRGVVRLRRASTVELGVEAAGLDQVGQDDRIGGGPGGPPGPVADHQVRIDRIEPELGSASDQGFEVAKPSHPLPSYSIVPRAGADAGASRHASQNWIGRIVE